MQIEEATALVTGANRGLGRAFVRELLQRGARRVYAGARDPEAFELADLDGDRVRVVELDITDRAQIEAAARHARDVTLLVNNAGTSTWEPLIDGDLERIRLDLDVHLFGTLHMVRAFAPVLAGNGGGAVVNVLSASSWFAYPGNNPYHLAKAAQWALTNGVRLELAEQETLVTAVHLGLADTDMSASFQVDKLAPADVARGALDGVRDGAWEVLLDDWSRTVKASLAGDPRDFYAQLPELV